MPPSTASLDPLPDHWYYFFGVLEPLSVLAGSYYALVLPERYHHELIPPAFLSSSKLQSGLQNAGVLSDPARMALGQLGSCYFLIMLNSALMFYALRKWLRGTNDVALERILRYLFFVLGAADWTHIGLTIWLLPNGPPTRTGLVGVHKATAVDKFRLLANPASWNSLLFGNIMITFILFCFRVLWWTGVARGSAIRAVTTPRAKKA
ncbi:hypothetical protein PaG_01754 [Moesziomyces aphidis]|uniref:DUF7704 domain-containing protein n=1 Tax=Moesziomyces aphidis TaxID=84754 RepID=W3VPJ1_MOEAP|nr:hypothetical protein PaG_01754 [Moesziomyces aphidis]